MSNFESRKEVNDKILENKRKELKQEEIYKIKRLREWEAVRGPRNGFKKNKELEVFEKKQKVTKKKMEREEWMTTLPDLSRSTQQHYKTKVIVILIIKY